MSSGLSFFKKGRSGMKKNLTFFILAICFVYSGNAQEKKLNYIIADVANVRQKPVSDAAIIGRLRIGNCFIMKKTEKDWVYIDTFNLNTGPVVMNGWIHESAITDQRVDSIFIDKQIHEAKTFADTIRWLERRIALVPNNKLYLSALQKGYIAQGDTTRAQETGRKLRRTDPTYIAQRQGNRILVRGMIDSSGEFHSLEWKQTPVSEDKSGWTVMDDSARATKKEALLLRVAFAGMLWYGGNCTDCPIQFPAPEVIPPASYNPNSPDFSGTGSEHFYSDIEGTTFFSICLGPTPNYYNSTIYATKAIYPVPVSGFIKKAEIDSLVWYTKILTGSTFDSSGVSDFHCSKLKDYNFIDVAVRGWSHSGIICQQRGIFNSKRDKVWPPEGHSFRDVGYYDYNPEVLFTEWFRFGPDATYPAFTITPVSTHFSFADFEEHNGYHGLHFISIGKFGTKITVVRSEYGGD
jgi:hypothetical protein